MRIPTEGLSKDELFARMESYRAGDVDWRSGRTWAYVYDPGREAEEVIKRAYTMYLTENALDPTVFPSILRLETELVAMAAAHLNGDGKVVGNFTSGGTESIMLAVKTARDYARAEAAHPRARDGPAGHRACGLPQGGLLPGVKTVLVPVDTATFKADVGAMRRAITPNTVLLVGSAVSYAHGVVDPIRELGQLALEHDLLLHVDACMGGFLLPYFRRLGAPVPDFDFSVPGVTSISMDFHKYAFAAKGASVVLYRNKDLRSTRSTLARSGPATPSSIPPCRAPSPAGRWRRRGRCCTSSATRGIWRSRARFSTRRGGSWRGSSRSRICGCWGGPR